MNLPKPPRGTLRIAAIALVGLGMPWLWVHGLTLWSIHVDFGLGFMENLRQLTGLTGPALASISGATFSMAAALLLAIALSATFGRTWFIYSVIFLLAFALGLVVMSLLVGSSLTSIVTHSITWLFGLFFLFFSWAASHFIKVGNE